jgi:hypothetical protein
MAGNKTEIPSIELLDRNRDVVNAIRTVSRATRVEPDWHYLINLLELSCCVCVREHELQ